MTVQMHSQTSPDIRLAARQGLLPARGSRWLAGFGNMFSKEMGEWFHTRRWVWQAVIWLAIINGAVAFALFILPMFKAMGMETLDMIPPVVTGLYWYIIMVVLGGIIGVIILCQDEIIQEKQSGTAAWILSKPVARPAFILAKLLSNTIGAMVFIVVLPGLVTIGETYLATRQWVPLVPLLAGMGVPMLALFFYLSLAILLGILFESRGPVLGITFGIFLGGRLIMNFFPPLGYVLPIGMDGIAQGLILGLPLPAWAVSELISTAVLSLVFILVALWRFQHQEF